MIHSHPTNHATGWLEGGLSTSVERAIIVADNGLAVEAILATPQGGHFFGSPHTMLRYENASWRPLLAAWSNFENCRVAGAKDANIRAAEVWARTLSGAESLALAPAIDEALGAYALAHKEDICS